MRRSVAAASAVLVAGASLAIASSASAASIPTGPSNDTTNASLYGLFNQAYGGLENADAALNAAGDTTTPCTPSDSTPACSSGFPPETGSTALTATQAQQIAADFTGQTINGTAPQSHTPSYATEMQGADPTYSTDAPKVATAGTSWGNLQSLIGITADDPTDFPGGFYTVDSDVSISSTATVTAIGKPTAYSVSFGASGAAAKGYVLPSAFTLTFPADFTINTALVGSEITSAQESNPPTANAIGTATVTSPVIAALVPGSKGVDSTASVYAVATSSLTQPDFEVYLGQGIYILGSLTGVTFPLTVSFTEPVVSGVPTPLPVSSVTMNFPAATSPLEATSCTDVGTLTGTMTDSLTTLASTYFGDSTDSGALNMTATPTVVTNDCTATPAAVKPTLSGSASGLTNGKPTFTLKVKTGTAFSSATVSLPSGLKFVKTSAKKLAKKISASGAKIKSVRISRGKLVITFKSAVTSTRLKSKKGLISETAGLMKKIKRHKTKKLRFKVKAGSTSISTSVKA